jgi:hypothetical protein
MPERPANKRDSRRRDPGRVLRRLHKFAWKSLHHLEKEARCRARFDPAPAPRPPVLDRARILSLPREFDPVSALFGSRLPARRTGRITLFSQPARERRISNGPSTRRNVERPASRTPQAVLLSFWTPAFCRRIPPARPNGATRYRRPSGPRLPVSSFPAGQARPDAIIKLNLRTVKVR